MDVLFTQEIPRTLFVSRYFNLGTTQLLTLAQQGTPLWKGLYYFTNYKLDLSRWTYTTMYYDECDGFIWLQTLVRPFLHAYIVAGLLPRASTTTLSSMVGLRHNILWYISLRGSPILLGCVVFSHIVC